MKNINHKRAFLLSLVLVVMGVTINSTTDLGSTGTVFIALGGFFFILSMTRKKELDEKG